MKIFVKCRTIVLVILVFGLCPIFIPNQGISETAARFALLNNNGNLVKLSSLLKEKNIIIAFWASYCVPCKREIPQLIELEKKYGKNKDLKLVLINIDKEGKEKAMPVLSDIEVSCECLFDMYQLVIKNYVPDLKIPATFLINKKGEIIFKAVGESQENIKNLESAISKMKQV